MCLSLLSSLYNIALRFTTRILTRLSFLRPTSRKWEKSYIPNQFLRFRTRKADSPIPSTYGPGGAVGGAVFAVIRCRGWRVLPVFCGGVGVVVLCVLVVWCCGVVIFLYRDAGGAVGVVLSCVGDLYI